MKITVLHGQHHKGSTYNITRLFLNKLAGENTEIVEFFMPGDTPPSCVGCCNCFIKGETPVSPCGDCAAGGQGN